MRMVTRCKIDNGVGSWNWGNSLPSSQVTEFPFRVSALLQRPRGNMEFAVKQGAFLPNFSEFRPLLPAHDHRNDHHVDDEDGYRPDNRYVHREAQPHARSRGHVYAPADAPCTDVRG